MPADSWLRPILAELVSATDLAAIDAAVTDSYWEAAARVSALDDDAILAAVEKRLRVPSAKRLLVSSQARERVSEELARRYRILPLSLAGDTLEIATANPYDMDCERTIAFSSGRRVRMLLAPPSRIDKRIDEVYRPEDAVAKILDGVAERRELEELPEPADESHAFLDESAIERPIVKLVDHIIAEGIASRASDIHLEAEEQGIAVRYRVDGVLRQAMTLPRMIGIPLVSRIKIMANMDIADRLRPQGGRARVGSNGAGIDLRVSTLPSAHGEKVVIRILDARTTARSLDSLGFSRDEIARILKLLDAREGLVLVTGPTGSGKTTTLYAMLRHLQSRGVNIVTVEDPVEYRTPGIVQVQVNEKAGLTFASALRSILRQDPDIVLIGEIRDRETAAIAIQASLTGHLVLATLHTIDACSSIARLSDLGVEPQKLAAALKGAIAQRLVRRLCGCGSGSGCARCGGTGFHGRIAVAEIVISTPELERRIMQGDGVASLSGAARADGAGSIWESGLEHVTAGDTTVQELLRVVERPVEEPVPAETALRYHSSTRKAKGEMTQIKTGVVDVYVLAREADAWRVLTLQRAEDTRCPGSWESVHGHILDGEKPEAAALRELREETGLEAERLYNVTVSAFYLHREQTVQLAIAFAAVVSPAASITLGPEHASHEWLALPDAALRFSWPREREALTHIPVLLPDGKAGSLEDVLRII
ncbi:MAG TPA: ATPase, T2SS/T4P/T4SS family [Gemmatimonadaceae bacterium]|nr:ATPase, T2SS/T4P/T4SS family [Gemmatimonadaceae bacterium]